jgi:16S rRNA (guanine1207-N2)-methyltransferase
MDPTNSLFLEFFKPKSNERVLLLEGGDGNLAKQIATLMSNGEVLTLARDVRQIRKAQVLLTTVPNAKATEDVLPKDKCCWDTVLLKVPQERRYARALLLSAWLALRPDGQLYVAGRSQVGAKAVITDAKRLFRNAVVLGYKGHQRIARSVRGVSLPDPLPEGFDEPGIAPNSTYIINVVRPEGTLFLQSHPGIFSRDAIDEGTRILLEYLHVKPNERTWDVGCGMGIIGLSLALAGVHEVAMSDVNLLAVRYAQNNAERNGLADKVRVFAEDGICPQYGKWDLIVSNPAFHEGREVDTSMADKLIANAPSVLAPGGRLLLVANRFLNYDKKMRQYFKKVTRIADTPEFHVLEAR